MSYRHSTNNACGTRRTLTRVALFSFLLLLTIITTSLLQTAETPPADKPKPASSAVPHDGDSVRVRLPDIELPAAGGQAVSLKSLCGTQATVLVFISAECPISNGYVPTLNEVAKDYGERGVAVVAVNPNDGQSLKEIAEHVREFQIGYRVLKDAGAKLAGKLNATHCPEAFVFDARGELRYQGRIDDRYMRRGGAAKDVRSHDLKRTLDELLAGKVVSVAKTEAVGCPIVGRSRTNPGADAPGSPNRTADVTYSRDVSRVLQKHCQQCHRPGGIGPFALLTYEQAVSWADDIQSFTADRTMPPWKPVDGFGEFHNRRVMPQAEIDQLAAWVKAGCPEGNARDLPEPLTFNDSWTMGEPDVIIQPSESFELYASGKDVYRCFVLPTNFDRDVYVTALEVLPGNAKVVHHVIAFLDTSHRSEQLDAADPGLGYATNAGFPGFFPAGGLGGWAPGNSPRRLPEGMAKVLPKGANIVMQVHYHPSGKPETDLTRLGLHFAKPPVTRAVRSIPVMPAGGPLSGMKIPAGAKHHEVTASLTLPRDLLAVAITPHMHLIGRDMKVTATLPDDTVVPLIHIQNWDFNWQEGYAFREPVSLPRGTRIDMVAHFDNSAENPFNPRNPPQLVKWGEQTTDEMCIAFIEVVSREAAKSPADLKAPLPGDLLIDFLKGEFSRKKPQK
jgi:peroxiredoxin/mono/diheme cytochrome c family protein